MKNVQGNIYVSVSEFRLLSGKYCEFNLWKNTLRLEVSEKFHDVNMKLFTVKLYDSQYCQNNISC